jgi:hypothetical protein
MNTTHCPICGAPANWQDLVRPPWERNLDARGWDRTEWSAFGAGVIQQAIQAGATYEKRRPTRAASVASDVTVPAAQSAISGAIVGVIAGSGAALCGAGWHSLWWGAGAGALGVGLAWLVILREHRAALWEVERIIGRDLDRDGHVGQPVPTKRQPVQVEVVERDHRGRLKRMQWLKLPPTVTDDHLQAIAHAVLIDGQDFSRRKLQDAMSVEAYGLLADAMLKGGLLRYKGKTQNAGVELTSSGRAFLRQFLEDRER